MLPVRPPSGKDISENRKGQVTVQQEGKGMTTSSASLSPNHVSVQTEVFRPPLSYPVHPYDEMLTRTAERYQEHVAVISKEVNLTYRELEALVNAFANA